MLANFSTDTVYSGSGQSIGTYGYIKVQKSSLPTLFTDEFFDYFTEFADTKVQDSGYNWVSIILDDGTGFCFNGSNTVAVDYGHLDNEGCITTKLGICYRSSSADGYKCIRFIPNPTILQEASAPNNEFNPIDEIIFSTTAEENGLADTAFYVEGKVISRFDMSGYDTIELSTDYGDIYISSLLVPLDIDGGDTAIVYFVYTGFSITYDHPCGAYIYHE